MLTNRTAASLVQLFRALSQDAVRLLLIKHLNTDPKPFTVDHLLKIVISAKSDELTGLLIEVVGGSTAIRTDAQTKYVFDGRHADLCGHLRADGFAVVEDSLVRLLPIAEPVAQISDYLEDTLAGSGLDPDGEVTRLLRKSSTSISSAEPDFTDATTKARITLETVARRAAAAIAISRGKAPPDDTWGNALAFLRSEEVVTVTEEKALASVYKLISPGAHLPRGLTDEQWALLARSFSVSGAYFLLHQYLAVVAQ